MITKKLKELYCVDTISQDKGWKKVQEAIADIDEEILIDFGNTNVVDPWQCSEFKQLLKNNLVHMQFVNSENIVNRIKMMCIIDGLDESHITNVEVEIPKEKSPEEKKIEHYGNELIHLFSVDSNGIATLELDKKYSQIQSTNTLSYIEYAIREIHDVQCVDKFILKIGKLVILPNVLQVIANMMVQFELEGFHLQVDSDDKEVITNMGLFIHIATTNKYDTPQRMNAIVKNLKLNTPGMLIKYKKSKALDEFGREGKGEVISSRVAIFRGIKQSKDGVPLAQVETFNNDNFYTIEHWMVEHDYEEPTSLGNEILEIPLDNLGVCDLFLGSKYHFIMPIQREESESQVVIKSVDENGKNIKVKCTIPERMKLVFNSWGIQYDKQSLEDSIIKTQEELQRIKDGQVNSIEGICEQF